jgi:hypothetical protein
MELSGSVHARTFASAERFNEKLMNTRNRSADIRLMPSMGKDK